MRQALELALEALQTLHDENMDYLTRNKLGGENNQCMVFAREAITAIKEALAQPEQEPVAWATREDFYRELDRSVERIRKEMEIKSVTMRCKDYDLALPIIDTHFGRVLVGQVSTPPQRKPLTDEDIAEFAERMEASDPTDSFWREFARAIEAAHGIKE